MKQLMATIRAFAGNVTPKEGAGNGALLSLAEKKALCELLGTTYGGETTFALPDLRRRGALRPGPGPHLANCLQGLAGGEEQVGR